MNIDKINNPHFFYSKEKKMRPARIKAGRHRYPVLNSHLMSPGSPFFCDIKNFIVTPEQTVWHRVFVFGFCDNKSRCL